MRSPHIFETYYYGDKKWDKYLIDIQETVETARAQASAIGEAQLGEMQAQTAQMGRIHDTLRSGFEELGAQFQWGFTLLADRMDQHIKMVARIASQLDQIHNTLQSPLLTQARELFRLGQDRLRKGLKDKALEAFLQAEQKNEVDFPLQLQIGTLFLYGEDRDNNVIDIAQAERHLLLAARYAGAEKGLIPKWNEYCAQAYFHAGVAAYLAGEKEYLAGRQDGMRNCLGRAVGFLRNAVELWPEFLESTYTLAKCHSLLGQLDEVRKKFQYLSDYDRRYLAKASKDKDFSSFLTDVELVFRQSAVAPGPRALSTLAQIAKTEEAIGWARRIGLRRICETSEEEVKPLESVENDLFEGRRSLQGVDVDIEALNAHVVATRRDVEQSIERALDNRIRDVEAQITSAESRVVGGEHSSEELRKRMAETSGTKMGCQVSFLFFVGSIILVGVLGTLVIGEASLQKYGGGIGTICAVVAAIIGAYIGSEVSRRKQNRPYVLQVEEIARVLEESRRTLPSLTNTRDETKAELARFRAWQSLGRGSN